MTYEELQEENAKLKKLVGAFETLEKSLVAEIERLPKRTARKILHGLEDMANNGVYQGSLTVPQMRVFFKENYEVE